LVTFSNQLKEQFKDFTAFVQKFKVSFRNLLMNVKKRYPSWQICMNQTQRKRIYYPSLNLLSVVGLQADAARGGHFRNS